MKPRTVHKEKTMKYYAVNGSPRKKNNTATVLAKALEGVVAAQPDAQT